MSPCGEGAVQEDVDRPSPLGAGLGVGRAQQRLILILGASGKKVSVPKRMAFATYCVTPVI